MGLRDTGGQRNVGWEGQSRLAAPGGPTPRGPGAGRAAEAPERTNLRAVSRARSRGHGMHPLCSVVVLPTPPVARPAFRLTTAQSLSCQFWRRRDGAELTDRRRDGMRAPWRIGASRADHETRLLRWMEHLIFISDSPTLHTST